MRPCACAEPCVRCCVTRPRSLCRRPAQPARAIEIDVVRYHAFRYARAFWLFPVHRLAKLQVGPKAAGTQRNVEPARRVLAELLHATVRSAVGAVAGGELARVATFRIVAAADEATELA